MESLTCLSKDCIELLHRNNLMKPLIKSELIKDKISSIQVKKEEQDTIIKLVKEKFGIKDDNDMNLFLESNSMTKSQFEYQALSEKRILEYSEKNFDHKVESHFLNRKPALDIVIYSLLRVKDEFKARELYLRIIEKETDFGELAKSYSEGIEKKTLGIVGPVPLNQAHPKLINHLKNSKPGEVQPPFNLENYSLIIRVESFDSAKLDDYMRKKMQEELFLKSIESEIESLNQKILNKTFLHSEIKI
ncbi:hypothetical protein DNJ72_09030 [Prochlorococcus marinus XMU1403]|uniref:peptidylprolyl isomerase n=1 Tax=Prochlorococcus marinus TaxID=1219 RepID=UPI000D9D4A7B|nr:peptidylprolyl isomerase [Prochlorococcus marinus]MBW3050282.1 hypothetical protein [Prochlorococcus marinus str. MU1403]PYE00469.1 hypothetical protein DNJ72_09030 [Prochlorococcus marinus XMU1403]